MARKIDTPAGTIYPVDDGFVCANGGGYLPGCYETFEAAEFALGIDCNALQALQDAANKRVGGCGGIITMSDLTKS